MYMQQVQKNNFHKRPKEPKYTFQPFPELFQEPSCGCPWRTVSLASSPGSLGESCDHQTQEQETGLATELGIQHWKLQGRRVGTNSHRTDPAAFVLGTWTASYLSYGSWGDNLLLTLRLNDCCDDSGAAAYRGTSGLFWGCHGAQSAFKQCKNVYPGITYQDYEIPLVRDLSIGLFRANFIKYVSKQKQNKKILFRGSELQDRPCKTLSLHIICIVANFIFHWSFRSCKIFY